MPASLELQERYGADLQVIFVEAQKVSHEEMERFALGRKWLGGRSMWSKERVVDVAGRQLPKFALLSNEGEVLLSGNPLTQHQDIEVAIEAEIRRADDVPDDLPREVRNAVRDDLHGRRGKAIARAEALVDDEDPEVAAAASALRDELRARAERALARARRLLESGRVLEAEDLVDELVSDLAGADELQERARELEAILAAPEMRTEKRAAKKLRRLEAKLFSEGLDERVIRDLERFAEREAGTHAARIAAGLVLLAKGDE